MLKPVWHHNSEETAPGSRQPDTSTTVGILCPPVTGPHWSPLVSTALVSTGLHWSLVPAPMMVTIPLLTRQQRGVLAVVGAFLLQLVAGSYNGTFGNLLPYLTSYLRQVGQGAEGDDQHRI